MLLLLLTLVSAGAFFFYGFETLFKVATRGEYERYGMPQMRVFVGSAQLLGSLGLLIGLVVTPLGIAASAGLLSMMVLGLLVRYRIHDLPRLMVPAATLAIVNAGVLALHLS